MMKRQASINPSNINFKLRQLALLSALAETGTLRAAATRISVSQSGATRLLHELESMLGVKLFERVKGRMIVTTAGEMMTAHANSLQSGMLHAYLETIEAARGNAGQLRLGIFSSLNPDLLARSLLAVRTRLPNVKVQVDEAPQEFLTGALRRCDFDAIIGRLLVRASADDLKYEILYRESFCVVCGANNRLSKIDREVTLEQLIDAQWVLAPTDSVFGQQIDAWCIAHYGRAPSGTIITRSLLAHVALLWRSDYIGVLPAGLARFLEQTGQVRILVQSVGNIQGLVTLITRAREPVRPSVAVLRSALQSADH